MNKWLKYFISSVVFCIMYILVEYILTKSINIKMVIVTTIMYITLYIVLDLISNKIEK